MVLHLYTLAILEDDKLWRVYGPLALIHRDTRSPAFSRGNPLKTFRIKPDSASHETRSKFFQRLLVTPVATVFRVAVGIQPSQEGTDAAVS